MTDRPKNFEWYSNGAGRWFVRITDLDLWERDQQNRSYTAHLSQQPMGLGVCPTCGQQWPFNVSCQMQSPLMGMVP